VTPASEPAAGRYRGGRVRAYKFLDADGCALFSGVRWPLPDGDAPGEWVEAGSVRPCRVGVHAVRPDHVAYWLSWTMWEIELDGEIVESRHKLAASRGRIVGRVDGYEEARRELAELGAWRSRDRAVAALRGPRVAEFGLRRKAARLVERMAGCASIAELRDMGRAIAEVTSTNTYAGAAAALAVDAARTTLHGEPPEAPFVACCSAGHAAAGPAGDQTAFDAGYAAERAFQSEWLTTRLDLS
jgi:hypothetical protein